MISYYCGKPGNGKTLAAVRAAVRELMMGDRVIVTNVSFKLAELEYYLLQNYGDRYLEKFKDVSVRERFLLLDDVELKTFYHHRTKRNVVRTYQNKEAWKRGERLEDKVLWDAGICLDVSAAKDGGVFYILDEFHIGFNSRNWQSTGDEALFYFSQHRKLGDDVICITQAVENVDKQCRSVAQDFIYFRHMAKSKMGVFSMPNLFIWQSFLKPISSGATKPLETGLFKLDVEGYCKCYDTRKGVGLVGVGSADVGRSKRGVPWYVGVLGIVLLACMPLYGMQLVKMYLNRGSVPADSRKSVSAVEEKRTSAPQPGSNFVPQSQFGLRFSANDVSAVSNVQSDVFCTGFFNAPDGEALVFLSDGRTCHSSWGEVQEIHPGKVKVDGEWYKVHMPAGAGVYQPSVAVETTASTGYGVSEPESYSTVAVLPQHSYEQNLHNIHRGGFSANVQNGEVAR